MSSTYAISNGEASDGISYSGQYEVFLNFRGSDTRNSFTDHLYNKLNDAKIRTYQDDKALQIGEEIGPQLIEGINQSKIAIPIFSKGYAESKWCLKELAHIEKCKRTKGLKVMPIFYNVTPHDVRNQTGDFEKAFVSHEIQYGDETTSWKEALNMVGALKGWDIQSGGNRLEGEVLKEVTTKVLSELQKPYPIVMDCLVGVDHHVEEILNKLRAEVRGVQILGIYGMGGIGKTTLAKVIYNHLLSQFENSSFLTDVRETFQSKGMVFLQNQLISSLLMMESSSITNIDEGIVAISTRFSNKKALVVLDDVDDNFQLQGLVGKRNWFGSGTRIIITTRNKSILDFIQVDWAFKHIGMDLPQALQLFSKHAFQDDKPRETYGELSTKIVKTIGGLPLALGIVGSLLCGKDMKYWHGILRKLEKVPREEVAEKLKISFETLNKCDKHIFLDIACFYIGIDHRIAIQHWDDSILFPKEEIELLQEFSLLKVKEDNSLWMHDQLRDYDRDIVCQEDIINPKNRRRLWNKDEATKAFMTKGGTEKIQGICVELNPNGFEALHFVIEGPRPLDRASYRHRSRNRSRSARSQSWSAISRPRSARSTSPSWSARSRSQSTRSRSQELARSQSQERSKEPLPLIRSQERTRSPSRERSEVPRIRSQERTRSSSREHARNPSWECLPQSARSRSREHAKSPSLECSEVTRIRSREHARSPSLERTKNPSRERARNPSRERLPRSARSRSRERLPRSARSRSRERLLRSARSRSRERARNPSQERLPQRARSPSQEHARNPSRERLPWSTKSRSRERARNPSRESARNSSRERLPRSARSRSRERARSLSRERARSPSRERARSPSREHLPRSTRSPSREHAKNPSREHARNPSQERLPQRAKSRSWEHARRPSREHARRPSREHARNPSRERLPRSARSPSQERARNISRERARNLSRERLPRSARSRFWKHARCPSRERARNPSREHARNSSRERLPQSAKRRPHGARNHHPISKG